MNYKRLLAVLASFCLVLLAQPALAAKGFSYSWMEGGYRNLDSDSSEGDGFETGFSFGATKNFHIIGRYSRIYVDKIEGLSSVSMDLDEFKIGFGGNYSIMDKVDLVMDAQYIDEQFTGRARREGGGYVAGTSPKVNINEDQEGYDVDFYARIRAMKKLEVTPHILYRDVGDNSGVGYGLGLVYNFYKKLSVRARVTSFSEDSATNLFLGVRVDM